MKLIKYALPLISLALSNPAANGAQPAPPLSGMPAAQAHVARMDPDHDGRISIAENAADARRTFAKLDANADGHITLAELEAGRPADAPPASPGAAKKRFDAMDADHDGKITLAEQLAAAQVSFVKMDLDHDGFLVPAEILAAHNANR